MTDDMIWKSGSQDIRKSNNPSSTSTGIHSIIVFVVDVYSIKISAEDKVCQLICASCRVMALRSWLKYGSESADHEFDACVVVFGLQELTSCITICCSEEVCSDELDWIIPHFY